MRCTRARIRILERSPQNVNERSTTRHTYITLLKRHTKHTHTEHTSFRVGFAWRALVVRPFASSPCLQLFAVSICGLLSNCFAGQLVNDRPFASREARRYVGEAHREQGVDISGAMTPTQHISESLVLKWKTLCRRKLLGSRNWKRKLTLRFILSFLAMSPGVRFKAMGKPSSGFYSQAYSQSADMTRLRLHGIAD